MLESVVENLHRKSVLSPVGIVVILLNLTESPRQVFVVVNSAIGPGRMVHNAAVVSEQPVDAPAINVML